MRFRKRQSLIDYHDLTLPDLPAELEGLRIVQVSDIHADRPRRRHREIWDELANLHADLLFLGGDYMDHPGEERHALEVTRRVVESIRPRLGVFGVLGNHDTRTLRLMLRELPVIWLENSVHRIDGASIDVLGYESWLYRSPDTVAVVEAMAAMKVDAHPGRRLRLMVSHYPMLLPAAAELGVDIMFSGHTHGGQVCLPPRRAMANSSDFPLHLTAGVLRHRNTLCVVSRGLGESTLPIRLFCPPHIPFYTLKRGAAMGGVRDEMEIVNVKPW